jgi:hypothetical protein
VVVDRFLRIWPPVLVTRAAACRSGAGNTGAVFSSPKNEDIKVFFVFSDLSRKSNKFSKKFFDCLKSSGFTLIPVLAGRGFFALWVNCQTFGNLSPPGVVVSTAPFAQI